ncbi:MAG: aldo/keto reductase, partial [Nitrospinae bacterium]|nr:aldo/keto reductase [Nitrospinota bacterium]
IRHIGVSNFDREYMEEAMHFTKHPIVANQFRLSLSFRASERQGLLRHAQENDWMFIAWRPIRDVLRMKEMPAILKEVCDKYKKTPVQIAINWLISQKNVVTLVKCGSENHLEEALGALNWSMEKDDIESLRSDFGV